MKPKLEGHTAPPVVGDVAASCLKMAKPLLRSETHGRKYEVTLPSIVGMGT